MPEGSRGSWLDKLRSGPTRVSGPALRAAIERLRSVRELGITLPAAARIPESRIAALARFANRENQKTEQKLFGVGRFW